MAISWYHPSKCGAVTDIIPGDSHVASKDAPRNDKLTLVGVDAYIDPRADVGIRPYNINFTNYDAIICKRGRFILADLLFTLAVLLYPYHRT